MHNTYSYTECEQATQIEKNLKDQGETIAIYVSTLQKIECIKGI